MGIRIRELTMIAAMLFVTVFVSVGGFKQLSAERRRKQKPIEAPAILQEIKSGYRSFALKLIKGW